MFRFRSVQRILAIGTATLLTVLLLAGCKGNEPDTSHSSAQTATSGDTTSATKKDSSTASTTAANGSAASASDKKTEGTAAPVSGKATISLKGNTASVSGTGASVEGSTVRITAGGDYTVTGTLNDGRIIVDAEKQAVRLTLDNASIHCTYSAPLYVFHAKETTVTLKNGTVNMLSDGAAYTYTDEYSSATDKEPNACFYSKGDLVINGGGALTVKASHNNGITSKDTLMVYEATITVTAQNHGINGKDCAVLSKATVKVDCKGDALRSTNDSGDQNKEGKTLGYITLTDCSLNLTAGEDGIQAESSLAIKGGNTTVTTTGDTASVSSKGLKAGAALTVDSGKFSLHCADDAVHCNGSSSIKGGTFTVHSGDDAFHADETLTISGGDITVTSSYEGLEGNIVAISGGTLHITARDDGINAAGGADGSGGFQMGGRPDDGGFGSDWQPMSAMTPAAATTGSQITISGGYTVIDAGGDGIDSNGNVCMSGGTLLIFGPTNSGNGALDYDGSFSLTDGTLLALGASGMAQSPNALTQYGISVTFERSLTAGSYIQLKTADGETVIRAEKTAQNLIYSAPLFKKGAAVTVSYGGSYTGGTVKDGLASGGKYNGGTALTTLTLNDTLTTYGTVGVGGTPGGGMAGKPGRPSSWRR